MYRSFTLLLICATWLSAPPSASAVTIQWSPIGNPGNPADTVVESDGTTGYGSVPYAYKIGKYDVTNNQYAEFLNAKDPTGTNTLGLWNANMADALFGGISFSGGSANGSKYVLTAGRQDHPVIFVTWYDAVRFANWLNNGQASGDTETGAYTLGTVGASGVPINGNSITRNAGARVFLPSEDEWYKAAYYDPRTTAQGGPPSDSHYWQYATSSNATPLKSLPTATPNSANYFGVLDGPGGIGNLTDVGAYAGTTSPFGAFDMNGNAIQWNEILIGGSFRGLRGGSYNGGPEFLLSSFRYINDPSSFPQNENNFIGFRVATIPEPSTGVLAVVTCGLMWWWRKRFT